MLGGLSSEKQIKEPLNPFKKGKGLLQETQTILQETLSKLQETQKQEQEGHHGQREGKEATTQVHS